MPDPPQRLQEALAGRYRIERELDRGGMSTVYLAEDLKHQCSVALKVLDPKLAAVLGPERFLREIKLSARLTHPHVLPLLDSGAAGEDLYYVMPYVVEGSLRGRLKREKQLPLDDALQIAREIADALSYAHAHGVVHRDIKPENILLSGGHAVVADFGIARAIDHAGGEKLTESGIAVGTPAYMSPEQAAGSRDLDGRSDLYSLGCVLYEMLAGVPPFSGTTAESLRHQHMNVAPRPVTELRPAVPGWVAVAVQRALAKAPADRFSPVTLFAEALAHPEIPPVPDPPLPRPQLTTHRALRRAERAGRRRGERRAWALSGVALALLAVLAYILIDYDHDPPQHIRSLAVLPLENLSGDAAQQYFANGMTEELITQLTPIESLTVISPTTVMYYASTKMKLPELARALHVDGIVAGSVMRSENLVRINVQLLDGPRDQLVWAESYERESKDVIRLQREVARDITRKIRLQLSPAQRARLATRDEVDPEAYELYLRGRFEWSRMTDEGVRQAMRYYERAIVRNPSDARPDAGIAYAYLVLAHIVRTMPCSVALPKAREHAEKALALDSTSAEAQTAMAGSLVFGEHDWAEGERRARLATKLNPGYPGGHLVYAILLGAEGRYEEALTHSDRAVELDPRFLIYNQNRAWQSYLLHRFDQAFLQASKTLHIESRFPPAIELQVRIQERLANYPEAVRRWRSMEALGMPAAVGDALDQSYRAAGARGYWQAQLQIAQRRRIGLRHSNTWIASVYSALGERDSAFAALDRAHAAIETDLIFCRSDPALDGLRDDPRMAAFIRRMGLTP